MKYLVGCVFLVLAQMTLAATFDHVYVFGDSLSDNGNFYSMAGGRSPQTPPYYKGHFSNGMVWAEDLVTTELLMTMNDLSDFAVGGAQTASTQIPGFLMQVSDYLDENAVDSNGLYVIWIGANNYLLSDEVTEAETDRATDDIITGLNQLVSAGIKNIVVINLPDIGVTPFAQTEDNKNHNTETSERFTNLVLLHNERLASKLAKFKEGAGSGVTLVEVDTYSLMNDLLAHPSDYCFVTADHPNGDDCITEVVDSCYHAAGGFSQDYTLCDKPDEFIFWDGVHPTRIVHRELATVIHEALNDNNLYPAHALSQKFSAPSEKMISQLKKTLG